MDAAPAGIFKADWLAWPTSARALIRTQQEETLALRQEGRVPLRGVKPEARMP